MDGSAFSARQTNLALPFSRAFRSCFAPTTTLFFFNSAKSPHWGIIHSFFLSIQMIIIRSFSKKSTKTFEKFRFFPFSSPPPQIFVCRSDSCHSERSAAKSKNPFSSPKVWGNGSFGALRLLRMTQNPMDFVCGGGQPAPYSNYCNRTINTNLQAVTWQSKAAPACADAALPVIV